MTPTHFLVCAVALWAFTAYCGSAWSASGPIRRQAEWAGALAGYLGVLFLMAALALAAKS